MKEFRAGISQSPSPATNGLGALTTGSDGNVWFTHTDQDKVGRIAPDGSVVEFDAPRSSGVPGVGLPAIASGPDGAIYYAAPDRAGTGSTISRMTTAGRVTATYTVPKRVVNAMAPGPDGRLWLGLGQLPADAPLVPSTGTEAGPMLASIDTGLAHYTAFAGVVDLPVQALVASTDGYMWFNQAGTVDRITPAGALVYGDAHGTGTVGLVGLARDDDGAFWTLFPSHVPFDCCSDRGSLTQGLFARVVPGQSATDLYGGVGYIGPDTRITNGPDGAQWATAPGQFAADADRIIRNQLGWSAEYVLPWPGRRPADITTGGDRNLWISESRGGGGLIRIDLSAPDITPPTVAINSPTDGLTVDLNEPVPAFFGCMDTGSAGLASCVAPVALGARVDTATPGPKAFSVTATDNAHNMTTRTVHYTVVGSGPAAPLASTAPPAIEPPAAPTPPGGLPAVAMPLVAPSPGGSMAQPAQRAPISEVLRRREVTAHLWTPAPGTLLATWRSGNTAIARSSTSASSSALTRIRANVSGRGMTLLRRAHRRHRGMTLTLSYQLILTTGRPTAVARTTFKLTG